MAAHRATWHLHPKIDCGRLGTDTGLIPVARSTRMARAAAKALLEQAGA